MNELEKRVKNLEDKLDMLLKSDRLILNKTLQFQDGRNIQTAQSTGTKIATSATQKIGFYGKTPTAQQTGIAATAAALQTALINLGLITA